jgi:hypothetical protein
MFSVADSVKEHPEWLLKDRHGNVINGYNLSVPEMRELWISDVINATKNGCTGGAFIDKSRNGTIGGMSPADAAQFKQAHMETLAELNDRLLAEGAFAINNNLGGLAEMRSMMIEGTSHIFIFVCLFHSHVISYHTIDLLICG